MSPRVVAAALAVLLLLPACDLRVATDVALRAGGAGSLEVAVAIDEELEELLTAAGVTLTTGLEAVDEETWDVTVADGADGTTVRLRAGFDDPAGFAALAATLHAPLDGEDVRLYEDLAVEALEGGAVSLSGRVGLLLPSTAGARGEGVAFDGDDLRRLLAERGDELVRYDLRVSLPAPPVEHDADEVDGTVLTWRAPLGELRAVRAVSEEPEGLPAIVLVAAGLAAMVAAALAVVLVRTRGR